MRKRNRAFLWVIALVMAIMLAAGPCATPARADLIDPRWDDAGLIEEPSAEDPAHDVADPSDETADDAGGQPVAEAGPGRTEARQGITARRGLLLLVPAVVVAALLAVKSIFVISRRDGTRAA